MRSDNIDNKKWAIGLSILGFIFLLYYVNIASVDVPTSDYIRIINSYIDDAFNIKNILVPDFIVRMPITYIFRIINIIFFKYSILFDRCVSIISIGILSYFILNHTRKRINNVIIRNISSILIFINIFALNDWEMVLNGTGYPIFIFFAAIIYLYDKIDRNILYDKKCEISTIVFLIITCILTGGDYIVALAITIIFFIILYLIYKNCNNIKTNSNSFYGLIIASLFCIIIYFISSHSGESAVFTHAGMKDISIFEAVLNDVTYPIRFIINTFSGMVIGIETLELAKIVGTVNAYIIYLIGIILLLIIIYTIFIIIKYKLYQYDIFSILLIIHSLVSVFLVFLARYAFLRDDYGMSSRYQLQFMFLLIGIIISLSIFFDKYLEKRKFALKIIAVLSILFITYGRVITTIDEMHKTSARKTCYMIAKEVALTIDNLNDSDENNKMIANAFEYAKGVNNIRQAFTILKTKKYNIYK